MSMIPDPPRNRGAVRRPYEHPPEPSGPSGAEFRAHFALRIGDRPALAFDARVAIAILGVAGWAPIAAWITRHVAE